VRQRKGKRGGPLGKPAAFFVASGGLAKEEVMAKPKAPLFGFGASGQLGKAIVFGNWKGIDVAREYVVPSNPQSAAQTTQRGYFTTAVDEWHDATNVLSATDKAAWNRLAGVQSSARSGFNEFVRRYVDERVAGGTGPGHFFGIANIALVHNAFKADIDDSLGGVLTVTLNVGSTKTFFSASSTDAQVGGLTSFAAFDTGFAAGTTVYYWFEAGVSGVGTGYKRSGLYTGVLT
jgi:hypothetical protein